MNVTFNHGVEGSSPSALTNEINNLNQSPDIDRGLHVRAVSANRLPQALTDCARHLARLRPGHPAGAHISNLIEQLKNYERNPILLKPMILMSVQRIEEARS
jgi:hypothetical protein